MLEHCFSFVKGKEREKVKVEEWWGGGDKNNEGERERVGRMMGEIGGERGREYFEKKGKKEDS